MLRNFVGTRTVSNDRIAKAKRRTHGAIVAAACSATSLLAIQSASAQPTNVWLGPSGTAWNVNSAWSEGTFPQINHSYTPQPGLDTYDPNNGQPYDRGDLVTFSGSTDTVVASPGSNYSAHSVLITNTGMTTFGGASGVGLVLSSGGITIDQNAGAVTFAQTNLNGTSQTYNLNSPNTTTWTVNVFNSNNGATVNWDLNNVGPVVLTSGISDGGTSVINFTKDGNGSVQLGNGSLKGSATINSGQVIVAGSNAFGTAAKTLTFNAPPVGGTATSVTTSNTSPRTIPAAISVTLNNTVPMSAFAGGGLTWAGTISGAGGITVTSGTVGFTGLVSNTGTLTVSGGICSMNNTGAMGATAISMSGGTANLSGQFSGASGLTMTGGTANINGPFSGAGGITISSGTANVGGAYSAGAVNMNGGVVTFSGAFSPTANISTTNGSMNVTGQFSGTSGVTMNGGTVQLSNSSNNFTGTNTVTTGKLGVRATNALGTFGGASDYTQVSNGGELSINTNANTTVNEELRLAGDGFGDGSTGALTVENNATGTVVAGPITLTDNATLHVTGTSQATFTNNITASGDYTLKLQGGANNTLGNGTISGNISLNNGGLNKVQSGLWLLTGALNYGGATTVSAGSLTLQTNLTTSSNVAVSGGTLKLDHSAGNNRIVKTGAVAVTGGNLDLTNNKLITTTSAGTPSGGIYTAGSVQQMVHDGLNGGAWNGIGIITSESNAAGSSALTTLAVATASDLGFGGTKTFGGQTVNGTDSLVMYTYNGDMDLNGTINGDDYARIDAGFASAGALTGYENGDLNYDGKINADDYFIIDKNYGHANDLGTFPQAPALGGASLAGVSAVPEPGALSLLALGAIGALKRRRRRV